MGQIYQIRPIFPSEWRAILSKSRFSTPWWVMFYTWHYKTSV